jgi:hypothetical protein
MTGRLIVLGTVAKAVAAIGTTMDAAAKHRAARPIAFADHPGTFPGRSRGVLLGISGSPLRPPSNSSSSIVLAPRSLATTFRQNST